MFGAREDDSEVFLEEFCAIGSSVAIKDSKKIIGLSPIGKYVFLLEDTAVSNFINEAILIVGAFPLP